MKYRINSYLCKVYLYKKPSQKGLTDNNYMRFLAAKENLELWEK